jgi:hypothetical protein
MRALFRRRTAAAIPVRPRPWSGRPEARAGDTPTGLEACPKSSPPRGSTIHRRLPAIDRESPGVRIGVRRDCSAGAAKETGDAGDGGDAVGRIWRSGKPAGGRALAGSDPASPILERPPGKRALAVCRPIAGDTRGTESDLEIPSPTFVETTAAGSASWLYSRCRRKPEQLLSNRPTTRVYLDWMARNGLQSFFETLVRGLIIGVVGATSLIIVILVLLAVFQPSFGSR